MIVVKVIVPLDAEAESSILVDAFTRSTCDRPCHVANTEWQAQKTNADVELLGRAREVFERRQLRNRSRPQLPHRGDLDRPASVASKCRRERAAHQGQRKLVPTARRCNHRQYALEHTFAKDQMYQRGSMAYPNRGEPLRGIARSRASYKICLALSKFAELCDPRLTAVRHWKHHPPRL
jgi:hypothetical protein